MDSLPLEILLEIASYIIKPDYYDGEQHAAIRLALARVSRKWSLVVEPEIYSTIHLKDTTELDDFASVFSGPGSHRRSILKELHVNIAIPAFSGADRGIYESDQDRLATNKFVSEAVAALFNTLSSWGSDPAVAIDLTIAMNSTKPGSHRRRLWQIQDDVVHDLEGVRTKPFDGQFNHSYIRLLDADMLPTVPCVQFMSPNGGDRNFHPSSLIALTAKVPAVEHLRWTYIEPDLYLKLRREMRNDFVQALQTFRLAPSTHQLDITIGLGTFRDPYGYRSLDIRRQPNIVFPHQHDPLCSALHRLVGNKVKKLVYEGPVHPSLFWPYSEGHEPREPFWPSLTDLRVEFDPRGLCGQWYFRGVHRPVRSYLEPLPVDTVGHWPPGYGPEEETNSALAYGQANGPSGRGMTCSWNHWVPDGLVNDEVMLPLLEALARAISQMQAIERAELYYPIPYYVDWIVTYSAPGAMSYLDKFVEGGTPLGAPRVVFYTGDWRPSQMVLDLFRAVARKRHQQDAIVTFFPDMGLERGCKERKARLVPDWA
jgi:hypothetical protein